MRGLHFFLGAWCATLGVVRLIMSFIEIVNRAPDFDALEFFVATFGVALGVTIMASAAELFD